MTQENLPYHNQDPFPGLKKGFPHSFFLEDLNDDIVSKIGSFTLGDFQFTLASRDDVLDNIPCLRPAQGNFSTRYIIGGVPELMNSMRSEFINSHGIHMETHVKEARQLFIGDHTISIYSSRENPQPEDYEQVADTLAILMDATPLSRYMPQTVYLSSEVIRTDAGTPANGRTINQVSTTVLFPNAFMQPHRIPGISNLQGTLVHEWAHQFSSWGYPSHIQKWCELGKWERYVDENQEELYVTNLPEQSLNDYSRRVPHEDFCESVAAAILKPEALGKISPQKLKFLQDFLQLNQRRKQDSSHVPYTIRPMDSHTPQQYPTSFLYTLAE